MHTYVQEEVSHVKMSDGIIITPPDATQPNPSRGTE